jgi:hypothetical protein
MSAKRDPIAVLGDMQGAFAGGPDARGRVLAVRDAMLVPRERELIATVTEPDPRDEGEWDALDALVRHRLSSAVFTAPEIFFHKEHMQIGQAVLRQCEIDAINRAHHDGTFEVTP